MVNILPPPTRPEPDAWVPPMPPTDLIFDDGEPLESNQHRVAMNVLIRSYQQYRGDATDYYVGGNMFIYYSSTQAKNQDFRGPDFFVVLDVDGTYSRLGWVVWEEEGRYPNVVIELLSPSTASVDLGVKKDLYEKVFRSQDYFVYDPFDATSLRGWSLQHSYTEIAPNDQGQLWCHTLGLWLGPWAGTIDRETCSWLRFFDNDGNLVLLPEEAAEKKAEAAEQRAETEAQRAEAERLRAERLAARLRELGEDPNNIP